MIAWFRGRGDREALKKLMVNESRLEQLARQRMSALSGRAQAVRELRELLRAGMIGPGEQPPPDSGIIERKA